MKNILGIIALLAVSFNSLSQKISLVSRSGEQRAEEIQAHSENELFTKNGKYKYSSIQLITFDSEHSIDNLLLQKLLRHNIRVFLINGEEITAHSKPLKGNKTIILVCSDSLEILYKRIGQHLALKGYAIETANKDFLTIKTALRETSKLNCNYFLNLIITQNTVSISAHWRVNNSNLAGTRESGFFDWEYDTDKEGAFSITANSVIYNDLVRNLSDFNKIKIQYR